MKLAVIGSRSFCDYDLLEAIITERFSVDQIDLILSGGAEGADTLAEQFAHKQNIPTKIFLPEYNLYGINAPLVRNRQIVDECTYLIAFWNMSSKGTENALKYCRLVKKPHQIINTTSDLVRFEI